MKWLLLSLSLVWSTITQPELDKIRTSFKLAPKSEREADKLIELLTNSPDPKNPVIQAYLGAVTTMKASWAFWPNQKLDYAGKGMKILNAAVKSDPGNLEVRWLRFSVETQMPAFLGYAHQKEDKAVIYSLLKTDLYQKRAGVTWVREIANFMRSYGSPNAEEQKVLTIYLH